MIDVQFPPWDGQPNRNSERAALMVVLESRCVDRDFASAQSFIEAFQGGGFFADLGLKCLVQWKIARGYFQGALHKPPPGHSGSRPCANGPRTPAEAGEQDRIPDSSSDAFFSRAWSAPLIPRALPQKCSYHRS